MAFTVPRTWTDGELVTKAIMDVHVRDNFLAMGPHLVNRKTADQSVTSSTALVNATSMTLPVGANEVWLFAFNIVYSGANTGDLKLAFTFPAAGRIDATAHWGNSAGTSALAEFSGTTTPTTSQIFTGSGGSTVHYLFPLPGIFTNSSTAGDLQLQFAQGTSDATATTMYTNSTVYGVKLA